MALLTIQTIVEAGLTHTFESAAGGGDTFPNANGDVMFYIKNGGGGSINVTFTVQQTTVKKPGFGDVTAADLVVAVGAGVDMLIGSFPTLKYNNSSSQVVVSYSGVTSVTVRTIRMPRDYR
jgi:hypothetical protein